MYKTTAISVSFQLDCLYIYWPRQHATMATHPSNPNPSTPCHLVLLHTWHTHKSLNLKYLALANCEISTFAVHQVNHTTGTLPPPLPLHTHHSELYCTLKAIVKRNSEFNLKYFYYMNQNILIQKDYFQNFSWFHFTLQVMRDYVHTDCAIDYSVLCFKWILIDDNYLNSFEEMYFLEELYKKMQKNHFFKFWQMPFTCKCISWNL